MRVVGKVKTQATITVLQPLEAGHDLGDLFVPDDVPAGEWWVRECRRMDINGGGTDRVVLAYQGGDVFHMMACRWMPDRDGWWQLSTGSLNNGARAAIVLATGHDAYLWREPGQ